jgi:hypothetical protein
MLFHEGCKLVTPLPGSPIRGVGKVPGIDSGELLPQSVLALIPIPFWLRPNLPMRARTEGGASGGQADRVTPNPIPLDGRLVNLSRWIGGWEAGVAAPTVNLAGASPVLDDNRPLKSSPSFLMPCVFSGGDG